MAPKNLIILILALNLTFQPGFSAVNDLPDIGSPSDSLLSKAREAQIGRSMYRSLLSAERIVLDPEIQEYIQDIGQKLAAHAQDGDFHFTFFVIDDPAINSFALPGGYIGIHSGLLLATKNESELAGVLAHEISHVTQRHISRAVFANQKASILTMAAMLGAILLGVVTGSSDMIQGGIVASQSAAVQQQINFTRANEYEADRFSVGVLASAGFDPMGLPAFFSTMARKSGPLSNQAPEFLRTHPVSITRIAETRGRASSYAVGEVQDAAGYTLSRARLRVLTSSTPERALLYFQGQIESPDGIDDLGNQYGIALSALGLGEYEKADKLFRDLLAGNEGIIPFHTGLAAALLGKNKVDEALATYQHALNLFPRNLPLSIRYSETLLEYGQPALAHKILLDLLNQVPPTAGQARLIALAASAAGDTADAHYYMSEYHLLTGNVIMASDQLRLALSIPELDNVQKARFLSRLEQIQEWMPDSLRAQKKTKSDDH